MLLIQGYPSDILCKIGYGGSTSLNQTYTSLLFFFVGKTTGWYKSGLVQSTLRNLFYTKYQRDIQG